MPSTKLRRELRAAGHHLSPVVQVGKEGVTEAVVRQLDEALLAHELVKVKVGTESPEDRFEVADAFGGDLDAQVAQILGRTILVYRRHPERPRFEAAPVAPGSARESTRKGRTAAKRAPARKGGAPRGGARGGANGARGGGRAGGARGAGGGSRTGGGRGRPSGGAGKTGGRR